MSVKICPSCGSDVPANNKFCGKCGANMEAVSPLPAANAAKTMFFGANQVPGRARLIVIKGEGVDGVTYQLNGTEHIAGRSEGAILFPDDPLLSPRHANFIYRNGKLNVHDEGSVNGVFVRIKTPTPVTSGGLFLIGEQLLQVEPATPDLGPMPDAEGTYFYASPKRPSKMRLIQRLRGGDIGMIYRSRGDTISHRPRGQRRELPRRSFHLGKACPGLHFLRRSVHADRSRLEEWHVRPNQRRGEPHPRRLRVRGAATPSRRNDLTNPKRP